MKASIWPVPAEFLNLPVLLAAKMMKPPSMLTSNDALGSAHTGPANDIPRVLADVPLPDVAVSTPSPKQQKPELLPGPGVPVFVQSSVLTVTLALQVAFPTCVALRFP